MTVTVAIYAYVEDYHTCSGIVNKPVNGGMDNAGKFMTSTSIFPKNIPDHLLLNVLDSYYSTITYNTIYAYVEDYHTCSSIFK